MSQDQVQALREHFRAFGPVSGVALCDEVDRYREALIEVLHEYDLWAEDANDGEFAIWSRDNFMAAFVKARRALVGGDPE